MHLQSLKAQWQKMTILLKEMVMLNYIMAVLVQINLHYKFSSKCYIRDPLFPIENKELQCLN